MYPSFIKTKFKIQSESVDAYKGEFLWRGSSIHKFKIKRLYTLFSPEQLRILSPEQICLSEAYNSFVPHFDVDASAKLNIYIGPGKGITRFWKIKPKAKPVMSKYYSENLADHHKVPNQYDPKDLEEISSFTAEKDDAYLLNISKIHSVDIPEGETRSFIQFSWFSIPFNLVAKKFEKYGFI